MRRRQFLALAGTALGSGCSGLVPSGGSSILDSAGDDRELPSFDGRQVVDLETGPRALAVQGVSVGSDGGPASIWGPAGGALRVGFTMTATGDHPATLRAMLVNTNDWENTFRLDEFPPFDETNHTRLRNRRFDERFEPETPDGVETGLYLAPTADHDLVDEESSVRLGPDGYWQTPDVPPKLPRSVTLEPGEYVTGDYYVLGHWDRTGFPTGTYYFGARDYRIGLSVWDTSTPGPTDDSRFTESVPSLPLDDDTPWFHEADESTLVYLEPDREQIETPGKLSFRLVNRSRSTVGGNPYAWSLYKLADGAWHKMAPRGVPLPSGAVSPGDSYGYSLSLFHGEGFDVDDSGADLAQTVGRLGGGRYAFAGGFLPDEDGPPAAMFDLDAPTVPLSVAENVTRTQDGDTVTLIFPSWGDDSHPPDATLTVRRSDETAEETLVREAVARRRMVALESALAAIDDVGSVVVRADKHAVENVTGYDSARRVFDFEGTTYVAEKDVEE